MISISPTGRAFKGLTRLLLASTSLSLLSACATHPASTIDGIAPRTDVAAISTSLETATATGQWPAQRWWTDFGDPQLQALIEAALADAPDMRLAEARVRKAMAAAQMDKAPLLPTLGATVAPQLNRQSYNLGLPLPRGWQDNGRASLDLNWELDFWGKNRAAYAAALSQAEAARAEQAHAALALSTAIAGEYALLAGHHADLEAANKALLVRQRSLALMTERARKGLENTAAVAQAKSAQAQAEGDILALNEAIALQRYRLAMLIGAGPDRAAAITRPTLEARMSGLPDNLPVALLGRRPDIVAARARIEAAAKRVDVAGRSFYPNVNLAGFVGLQSLNLANLLEADSLIGGVGPAISLPIFQGGRLRANYRLSEADYLGAVAQYDAAVAHALGEVAGTLSSQSLLAERLEHSRTALTSARQAYEIMDHRYQKGLANYLEVLAAQDGLIRAERAHTALQTRALTLNIDLIRALGGGYQAN